jgi:DNA-binding response OmpR family regulator
MNKKRILMCDDDVDILEIGKIVFEEKGYQVDILSDSVEIYQKIKASQPDVIILDLWMPKCSGEEITRKLKSDLKTKNIPVIVISASCNLKNVAKSSGADAFLCKPFDIEELENIVAQNLN